MRSSCRFYQKPTLKKSKQKLVAQLPQAMEGIFDEVSDALERDRQLTEEVKIQQATQLSEFCRDFAPAIEFAVQHESSLWQFIKSGLSLLSSPLKAGLLLLPGASAAIEIRAGAPAGVASQCAGIKVSCVDGYLFDTILQRALSYFYRDITYTDPDQPPNLLTLNPCLSVNAVGNVIASQFTELGNQLCSATNNPIPGTTVTVRADNFANCATFQNSLQKLFSECNQQANQTGLIIGLSVTGGVLLVALLATCMIYLCKRNHPNP